MTYELELAAEAKEGPLMANDSKSNTKQEIISAAWGQFQRNGYNATTYATIADQLGIGRSLVQYHFPKKEELPISLISWVIEQSREALGVTDEEMRGDYVAFYRVGLCAFTYLLDEGFSLFLSEMLENRVITDALVEMNAKWAISHKNLEWNLSNDEIERSVIMAMGGFYDYLYHCLKTEKKFDVRSCLAMAVCASANSCDPGRSYTLEDFALTEAQSKQMKAVISVVSSRFKEETTNTN